MARIRSTKPEFWLDRKLARLLTRDERMLYMGLWNQSDEHSRALGDPNVIKGAIFPYDSDLTVEVIDAMIDRLDYAGVAVRYEVDGDPYLFLPKLADHQRLEPGKVKSRYPEPPQSVVARPSRVDGPVQQASPQVSEPAQEDPDSAQIFPDASEKTVVSPGKESLLYVAGSMEHVAGSMSCSPAPPPNMGEPRLPPPGSRSPREPSGFAEFWAAYPMRKAKGEALKAYAKALKKADAAEILEGAKRYVDDPGRKPEFTAYPATWLNGERWTDESVPTGGAGHIAESAEAMTARLIKLQQEATS